MGTYRTVTPNDDELERLGKEMLEWVRENKPLHLNEWYSLEKAILYEEFEDYIKHPVFRRYYEQSKNLVAKHYLGKDTLVSDSIKHRWQRIYFEDVRKDENEKLEYEIQLKSKQLAGDILTLDQLKKNLNLE